MKKKRPELAVVSAARDSRQTSAARADIDPDAFARAYGDYARRIYAYLLRFTGNHEDAEELVQIAFLKAWRGRDTFGGKSSLKTWLFAIAIHAARDHARKARWEKTGCAERLETAPDPRPAAGEALERTEAIERMRKALAELPETLRAPLMLVRFDGLSYREAAEALDVSADAVRMRLHRAHRILAAAFTEKETLS